MPLSKEGRIKLKCVFASRGKTLSKHEIHQVIAFTNSYLCEIVFSNYTATKTKYRTRINVVPDLIIQLSNINLYTYCHVYE
jgi:hypothetical protein